MKKRYIKKLTIAVNLTIILLLVAFIYFPGVFVNGIGDIFNLDRLGNIPFSGVFSYAAYCTPGVPCTYYNDSDCVGGCYGGVNYCCNDPDGSYCNNIYVCDGGGICSAPASGPKIPHPEYGVQCPYTPPPAPNAGQECNINDCNEAGGVWGYDGTICSGPTPDNPPGYGQECNINDCNEAGGTLECDGTTCSGPEPDNPPGYGQECNINDCNEAGGVLECDGTTCSGSVPNNPPGYGTPCQSDPNDCGERATGEKMCDTSQCSASTPSLPDGHGDFCESLENSCGMTNIGVNDCGTCSASTPSDSLCNSSPSVDTSSGSSGEDPVSEGNNCGVGSPPITLSWTFSDPDGGDTQSAYHIKISQGGSIIHNSGQISSSSYQYTPPLGTFAYGIVYTWEIKVWDNESPPANSVWIAGPGFITSPHQYPSPSFTWLPMVPGEDEAVSFTDTSVSYGGTSIALWDWTFEDGSPSSSSQQNPIVVFPSIGIKLITLELTDSDGFSCISAIQNVGVGIPFPEWEEIPPFGVELIDYFAGLFTR